MIGQTLSALVKDLEHSFSRAKKVAPLRSFRQVRWTRLIETDATGVTLKNILEEVCTKAKSP